MSRIPYGRLPSGKRFVGITPALLRVLRAHGPQEVGGSLVLVYGRSDAAIADALAARGITFATPDTAAPAQTQEQEPPP